MGKQDSIRGSGRLRRFGKPGVYLSDQIVARNLAHRTESIMMLHVGRVGSTVLGGMLNSHSRITWKGEIFNHTPARHVIQARTIDEVRDLVRIEAGNSAAEIFGFEVRHGPTQSLSPAITNLTLEQLLDLFREFLGKRILHLTRRNIIRCCVSAEMARRRHRWHQKDSAESLPIIDLPIRNYQFDYGRFDLLDVLDIIHRCNTDNRAEAAGFDVLELVYEDDIERDPGIAYRKVCDFLGVAHEYHAPRLAKIENRPLHCVLSNFAEVERYLYGTPYHSQLFD